MLVQKNESYGDSALNPKRVFSRLDAEATICVRLDDKISRMANDPKAFGEDVVKDMIGYLILLMIVRKRQAREECAALTEANVGRVGNVRYRTENIPLPTNAGAMSAYDTRIPTMLRSPKDVAESVAQTGPK
jgi:hypothetical protein